MYKKKTATRDSYGQALKELGAENLSVTVLTADLADPTRTAIFQKEFPERFIECGIAEANMYGIAAGLAAAGKIPFASTFAIFAAGRAYEQIRNSIAYPNLNVKIAATHGGITVGEDGATHQCIEDLALMRSIPGMVILNPCDDLSARAAVRHAAAWKGPVYLRFSRYAAEDVYQDFCPFEIGKGNVLCEGDDLTLAATGICVQSAMEAASLLLEYGIEARVLDLHTIKPLDEELVLQAADETGCIVTVEEHSVFGGLGSAVSQLICQKNPVPVLNIGIQDVFGESADAKELLKKHGLDAEGIFEQTLHFYYGTKNISQVLQHMLFWKKHSLRT